MSILFRPSTVDMARDAWNQSITHTTGGQSVTDIRKAMANRLRGVRAAYAGGEDALMFLIRKENEDPRKLRQRMARFHNVRVVKPIVDVLASLLYSEPPKRIVYGDTRPKSKVEIAQQMLEQLRAGQEPDAPDQDEVAANLGPWLAYQYMQSGGSDAMVEGARRALRDGYIGCKVWPHLLVKDDPAFFQGVRFSFAERAEDTIPIMDPDDPNVCVGVIETREADGDTWAGRLWVPGDSTAEPDEPEYYAEWVNVDEDLVPNGPVQEWYTDLLPFAFLGPFGVSLEDAVLEQKAAINRFSYRDNVLNAQGHAKLASRGPVAKDDTVDENGNRTLTTGEDALIELLADNGDLFFVNPNAPLGEHLEAIAHGLATAFRSYNMPADYWKDTATAERPEAKRLSWLPILIDRMAMVAVADRFERDLATIVLDMGNVFREEINAQDEDFDLPDWERETITVEVKFKENPLPTDTQMDRDYDYRLVSGGQITEVEWRYRQPGNADLEPERVARMVYTAERERASRQRAVVGSLFGVPEAPLGEI